MRYRAAQGKGKAAAPANVTGKVAHYATDPKGWEGRATAGHKPEIRKPGDLPESR